MEEVLLQERVDYALVAATKEEVSMILDSLNTRRHLYKTPFSAILGKLEGQDIVVVISNIGITNVAMASSFVLENFRVKTLVSIGIAGAYRNSGMKPGDVAIAEEEIYGDMGIDYGAAFELLDKLGFPLYKDERSIYYNSWPVTSSLLDTARGKGRLDSLPTDFSIRTGRFVTVAAVSGSIPRADALERRFGALCENMEGAAVAQAAKVYGVECFECRGISNIAGIREKGKWKITEAVNNSQMVFTELIKGN